MSSAATESSGFELFPSKMYINGKWTDSLGSKTFEVYNPANNQLLGSLPDANLEDLNLAVESANTAFKQWKSYTAATRSNILRKLFELTVQYKSELSDIITYENGKPLLDSNAEINASAKAYEWFSEEAKRVYGDIIPAPQENKRFLVTKQPVGVCGFITPWNFPSSMIARKAGAALAAGCTIVIKPSEDTPYSALALCRLAEMAGMPAGCINVLTASRASTPALGQGICEAPEIKKISFTGSTPVGKILMRHCAGTVKKMQMELGGNAPFIVFDSADLDKAVSGLIGCKFRCSGQTCICANRVLVQESIHDEFVAKLASAISAQLKVGSGFDKAVNQGPLINKTAVAKCAELVKDSETKGGKVILGGKAVNDGGNFFEPTLISGVTEQMKVAQEEIFGPIASIIKFKDEEEALRIANSVSVGLGGYFYSQNLSQIWRVAESMETGMVGINEAAISTIEAPFGGIKESGFGSEGSKYGINEYLNNKFMCMGI